MTDDIAAETVGEDSREENKHHEVARWRYAGARVPLRGSWSRPLRIVHRMGLVVLLCEFIGLARWSSFIVSRFSLTSDMALYGQAWFLIAHGHLNPYSTLFPPTFWHNAMELVMWPLALLWYVWPHAVTLLWVQDLATVGCEALLLTWMCEFAAIAEEREPHFRT